MKLVQISDSVPGTAGMGIVVGNENGVRVSRRPVGSCSYVVFQFRAGLAARPSAGRPSLIHSSHFWTELWGAGVSCSGAAASGVGVVGAIGLAPRTGCMTLPMAMALWGGMAASAASCSLSLYRVANVGRGRADINKELDANEKWRYAMCLLDGVELFAAGMTVKEICATNESLKSARVSWKTARAGGLSRPTRRRPEVPWSSTV